MGWAEAIQNVLTKGLDAASSVKIAQVQASTGGYDVTGPDGRVARTGQPFGGSIADVSPVVWIGGGVALVLLFVLIKKI